MQGFIDCLQESMDPRLKSSKVKLTKEFGVLGRGREVGDGLEGMVVSHCLPEGIMGVLHECCLDECMNE